MAQMRCDILAIRIGTGKSHNKCDTMTGKYRKLKPEEIWQLCNLNKIGGEIHLLCQGPLYNIVKVYFLYSYSELCKNPSKISSFSWLLGKKNIGTM